MADADRLAVAAALREIAALLAAKGESPFKVRAYERGARALESQDLDLPALVAGRRLQGVAGIGPALAARIAEMVTTGRSAVLEQLRAELPPGVVELQRVPGLSRARIGVLHRELGIRGIDDLRAAAEAGRVREVKGFGPATERKLLEAIRSLEAGGERMLLPDAWERAERLLAHLRGAPGIGEAAVAGSLRRWCETVGDVDLVAAGDDPEAVARHFARVPLAAAVLAEGGGHAKVRLAEGGEAEVIAVPPPRLAGVLLAATGSAAHLARLAARAQSRGLELRAGALYRDGRALPARTEEELYARLDLPFIPPEMREDAGEIEAADEGRFPGRLVCRDDLRGMVHCHTVYSDGRHTVEQMARAAEAMGARYITITDHSAAAFYANGLDEERLKRQWDEIARVQEKVKVRILRGTEADILQDGAIDWPDRVLEKMDVVIASIHGRMKMDAAEMTRRVEAAVRRPIFKIWGHALGRMLPHRPPFACDVERILDAVAESRCAVEINGDPHRLDMQPHWVRKARARGIRFVLSTDAHSTSQLAYIRYSVSVARKGWLTRDEVLNTRGPEEFAAAVRPA